MRALMALISSASPSIGMDCAIDATAYRSTNHNMLHFMLRGHTKWCLEEAWATTVGSKRVRV